MPHPDTNDAEKDKTQKGLPGDKVGRNFTLGHVRGGAEVTQLQQQLGLIH